MCVTMYIFLLRMKDFKATKAGTKERQVKCLIQAQNLVGDGKKLVFPQDQD